MEKFSVKESDNKWKHLHQIYVHRLHNDLNLAFTQGGFYGSYEKSDRIFISNTSLRKYIIRIKKPMITWYNIKRGYEICISSMSL